MASLLLFCNVTVDQRFLTGGSMLPQGLNKIPGGASHYAFYNMESLIDNFTNTYVCFYNLFDVKGA